MVRLAEAGASAILIASVSGHDIQQTQRILETCIPRNSAMARAAIDMLEAADDRKNNGSGKHQGGEVGNTADGEKEKPPKGWTFQGLRW